MFSMKEQVFLFNIFYFILSQLLIGGNGPWASMKKFDFEKSLPLTQWPNLVSLEYAVNCNHDW